VFLYLENYKSFVQIMGCRGVRARRPIQGVGGGWGYRGMRDKGRRGWYK
jgi:hypothetical protein